MMISLKDIKDEGKTISCHFYPEYLKANESFIRIDKESEEIIGVRKGKECCNIYIALARHQLATHIGKNQFPEIDFAMCG